MLQLNKLTKRKYGSSCSEKFGKFTEVCKFSEELFDKYD